MSSNFYTLTQRFLVRVQLRLSVIQDPVNEKTVNYVVMKYSCYNVFSNFIETPRNKFGIATELAQFIYSSTETGRF